MYNNKFPKVIDPASFSMGSITLDEITDYMKSGNSTFTLESTKLDKYYTYKVMKDTNHTTRYFVKRLFGQDNTGDFRLIGMFYDNNSDLHSPARHIYSTYGHGPEPMFAYFLEVLFGNRTWPDTLVFYRSDKCCACGRPLTTPESVKRGIGPSCLKRKEYDNGL